MVGKAATQCSVCGPPETLDSIQVDGVTTGVPKGVFNLKARQRSGRPLRGLMYPFSHAVSINNPKLRRKIFEYLVASATTSGASAGLRCEVADLCGADDCIGRQLVQALVGNYDAGRSAPAPVVAAAAAAVAGSAPAAFVHEPLSVPQYVDAVTVDAVQPFVTQNISPFFGRPGFLKLVDLVLRTTSDVLAVAPGADGAAAASLQFSVAERTYLSTVFPPILAAVNSTADHTLPLHLRPFLRTLAARARAFWTHLCANKPADYDSLFETTPLSVLGAAQRGMSCLSGPKELQRTYEWVPFSTLARRRARGAGTEAVPLQVDTASSGGGVAAVSPGVAASSSGSAGAGSAAPEVEERSCCQPSSRNGKLHGQQHRHHMGTSKAHTPCVLFFICRHGVVYSVFLEAHPESKQRILEVVLAMFPNVKLIYYDDSCNNFEYDFSRFPYHFADVQMLVDPTHSGNHGWPMTNCPSVFHHSTFTATSISTRNPALQEQTNSQWKPFLNSARFFSGPVAMHMIMRKQAMVNIQINQKLKGRAWVVAAADGSAVGGVGGIGAAASAGVELVESAADAAGKFEEELGGEIPDASRVIDLDADDEDVTADEARAFYDFAAMLARDEEPAGEIVGVGADEDEDIEAAVFAGAAHGGVSMNEDDDTHVGMDDEAVPVDLAESRLARSIEEATRVLAASASAAGSAAAVS